MNNKMRVGRRQSDGTWSGAIGAYLETTMTLAAAKNEGKSERRVTTAGLNTRNIRERALRVLPKVASDHRLEWLHEFTRDHWLEAFRMLCAESKAHANARGRKEAMDSTIDGHRRTLRTFVNHCASQGAISQKRRKEIVAALAPSRGGEKSYLIIPESEWDALLAIGRSQHWIVLLLLALGLYAAMRLSEMVALTWGDIRLDESKPWMEFPRDKRDGLKHRVTLRKNLTAVLVEWRDHLKREFGLDSIPGDWHVVPSRAPRAAARGHKTMSPEWPVILSQPVGLRAASYAIKKAIHELGYSREKTRFQAAHVLRRSSAEAIYQATKDPRLVAILLGHGYADEPNTQTSMKYLGHSDSTSELHAAFDAMDIALKRNALPSGGSVIAVGPDDILPAPSKAMPGGLSVQEILASVSRPELWERLVNSYSRDELDDIVTEVVVRTAQLGLSMPEQQLIVKTVWKSHQVALEIAQSRMIAA